MYKNKISVIALVALAVSATLLSGCGRKGLIRVNDEKISKDDFYARLERVPVQTTRGGQQVTLPAGQYVVEQMISEKLVMQLAKKENVTPTDAEVSKKMRLIKKNSGQDIRMVLARQGITEAEWKEQMIVSQAMTNLVTKGIKIPDDQVKKAYNQALSINPSPFKRPEQVKFSVVLVSNQEKINKAYDALKKGDTFSSVAKRLSEDPMAKQTGGAIDNWVAKDTKMVPQEIRNQVFTLSLNQYSKPFKASGGWCIVQLNKKRPPMTQDFAEVKDLIREQLAMQEGSAKNNVGKDLQKFTKSADIVVNSERYKQIPEMLKKQAGEQMKAAAQPAAPTAK